MSLSYRCDLIVTQIDGEQSWCENLVIECWEAIEVVAIQ